MKNFWFGVKPGTVADLINRHAAATGSIGYAMKMATHIGHMVRVYYNEYRGYWLVEHQWGERVVHYRGDFAGAVAAAKREHEINGPFGTVTFYDVPQELQRLCLDAGAVERIEGDEKAALPWQFEHVSTAFWTEKHVGIPAVSFLANATSEADYQAKLDAAHAKRRAAMGV